MAKISLKKMRERIRELFPDRVVHDDGAIVLSADGIPAALVPEKPNRPYAPPPWAKPLAPPREK